METHPKNYSVLILGRYEDLKLAQYSSVMDKLQGKNVHKDSLLSKSCSSVKLVRSAVIALTTTLHFLF
jgi:hypothetical protein